jgi:hypothetical protein
VKKRNLIRFSVIGAAAAVLPLVGASQAFGDYAPQSGDVVGVGGDTPQYAVDFLINGDTVGDAGFDATTGVNRVVPFDATGDGNGRQAYTQGSTEASPSYLNPTIVLRAGHSPVQRPQSSGAALSALEADTGTGSSEVINYVASASAPTSPTNVTGGLTYVKFGTDSIGLAVDSSATNAPATLTASQLLTIYTGGTATWASLGLGSSTDTIIPEVPPSTSSVAKSFLSTLKTANGGTTPTYGTNVQTVEQNDPTAITGATLAADGANAPKDAIVPFSASRLALWNGNVDGNGATGYFYNPATVFPGAGSPETPGVVLQSGSGALDIPISDYVIFRTNDITSPTPYQPGGTLNWVKTLFYNPAYTGPSSGVPEPFIETPGGQALIESSGVTPTYAYEGTVS